MNRSSGVTLVEVAIVITIVLILFMVGVRGMLVDKQDSIRILQSQGYSEIELGEKEWFFVGLRGCDSHDAAKVNFIALNPKGEKVGNLYVCLGWPFKGTTVRGD